MDCNTTKMFAIIPKSKVSIAKIKIPRRVLERSTCLSDTEDWGLSDQTAQRVD